MLRETRVVVLHAWRVADSATRAFSPSPLSSYQTCTMQKRGVCRYGSFLDHKSIGVSTGTAFWHMQDAVKIENLKIMTGQCQTMVAWMPDGKSGQQASGKDAMRSDVLKIDSDSQQGVANG